MNPRTPSGAAQIRRPDRTFWPAVGVGALVMGYGVTLLFIDPLHTVPVSTIRRFVVLLVLHDLILLPLVFGFSVVVLRRVPTPWLPPLRFALFTSAMVLLIAAWGLVAQWIDVQPGNDQVLPNNYLTSVAWLLTPIWLFALGWGYHARWRTPPQANTSARSAVGSSPRS